jgi:hypothetical protein
LQSVLVVVYSCAHTLQRFWQRTRTTFPAIMAMLRGVFIKPGYMAVARLLMCLAACDLQHEGLEKWACYECIHHEDVQPVVVPHVAKQVSMIWSRIAVWALRTGWSHHFPASGVPTNLLLCLVCNDVMLFWWCAGSGGCSSGGQHSAGAQAEGGGWPERSIPAPSGADETYSPRCLPRQRPQASSSRCTGAAFPKPAESGG